MHGERGIPTIVPLDEARDVQPETLIRVSTKTNYGFPEFIWVNALDDRSAKSWIEYADTVARSDNAPCVCVATDVFHAKGCDQEKRLRRRLWFDYVTATDSRVLAERHCRHHGHGRQFTELKCALVSNLAKADLSRAHQMSRYKLKRLFEISKYSRDDIWTAQTAVLLPIINEQRRHFCTQYSNFWRLPHIRKGGYLDHQIKCVIDLELGDMISQVNEHNLPIPEQEMEGLRLLNRVRNRLAHYDVISWRTLNQLIDLGIVNFTK